MSVSALLETMTYKAFTFVDVDDFSTQFRIRHIRQRLIVSHYREATSTDSQQRVSNFLSLVTLKAQKDHNVTVFLCPAEAIWLIDKDLLFCLVYTLG